MVFGRSTNRPLPFAEKFKKTLLNGEYIWPHTEPGVAAPLHRPTAGLDLAPSPKSTGSGPNEPLGAAQTSADDHLLGASSKTLAALDLTVSPQALRVPAMQLPPRRKAITWDELLRPAKLIDNAFLVDKFGHRYALQAPFAHGTFGSVRLALKRDPVVSQYYVAKEVQLTGPDGHSRPEEVLAAVRAEVEAAIQAKSPLTPHAVLQTDKSVFLLMPVISGDMFMLLEGIHDASPQSRFAGEKNETARTDALQTLAANFVLAAGKGLKFLHAANMAHRDLKTENMFFDRSGETMLADFGLVGANRLNGHVAGTWDYLPFEAMLPSRARSSLTPYSGITADIWGVGASLMFILTGRTPTQALAEQLVMGASTTELLKTTTSQSIAYKNAWTKLSNYMRSDQTALIPNGQTALENDFIDMLAETQNASPRLFPALLKALHPWPTKRPDVGALSDQVQAAMAGINLDLAPMIAKAGLGRAQHWAPDADAQLQLQRIEVARSRRQMRSGQQRKAYTPVRPSVQAAQTTLANIAEEPDVDEAKGQ